MACKLPEHAGTWNTAGYSVDCRCDGNGNFSARQSNMNGFQAPMDRYGNQFATRVEKNVEFGIIYADILQEANGGLCLMIGGIILSPRYITLEDARDAADVMLCRLVDGELLVEPMPDDTVTFTGGVDPDAYPIPEDGAEDQAADFTYDDYPGEVLPTGWDAQDHKAMFE